MPASFPTASSPLYVHDLEVNRIVHVRRSPERFGERSAHMLIRAAVGHAVARLTTTLEVGGWPLENRATLSPSLGLFVSRSGEPDQSTQHVDFDDLAQLIACLEAVEASARHLLVELRDSPPREFLPPVNAHPAE